MKYNLVGQGDQSNITVFIDGEMYVADSTHPNFKAIVAAVVADDEAVVDLFDVAKAVAKRFEKVSERVSVANGVVYFDGQEINNALTKQIVRYLDEGVEDYKSLVNFFEKVEQNQSEHSRNQLYEWLDRHDFTVASDGDFIAYKGVRGDFTSIHAGPAIVNGEAVNGHVPNPVGGVIEIDRSKVQFDPAVGCASGLHVGTWSYASTFGGGPTLKVKVNPRDVVSVPTDCDAQKMRVCRYLVLEQVAAPEGTALSTWRDDYDAIYCENCGDEADEFEVDERGWCGFCQDDYEDYCDLCGGPCGG